MDILWIMQTRVWRVLVSDLFESHQLLLDLCLKRCC